MTITQNDITNVVDWIKETFAAARKKTAIVGMSGGVDSAVIGALCIKALGKENVIAVTLPCESSNQSYLDAILVIDKFNPLHKHLNLDKIYLSYKESVFKSDCWRRMDRVSSGNIKARLRMIALYDFAAQYNGLVVGTTNYTEHLLGYATKYGDHGVDIEPIQDFYKTEVFEMARLLEVPEQIINKKPTADLWEGQTDEDEIGLSYEKIDQILKVRAKEGYYSIDVTEEEEIKVENLINISHHKRNVPPSFKKK